MWLMQCAMWGDFVGNASSLQNAYGQMAKRADKAQNQIADAIGAIKMKSSSPLVR